MDIIAIISTVIMIIGIVGMIYPVFPGTLVVFAGPLLYVILNGFEKLSIPVFVIIVILTILGSFVDNIASILGIKKFGASKKGLIGALVGGILGLIIFNIPGFLLGQFIGVISVELYSGKELKNSLTAGLGVFIGFIMGYLMKIALGGAILILFLAKVAIK